MTINNYISNYKNLLLREDLKNIKVPQINGKNLFNENTAYLYVYGKLNGFNGKYFDLEFLKEHDLKIKKYTSLEYYDFSFKKNVYVLKKDLIDNPTLDIEAENPTEKQLKDLALYINDKKIFSLSTPQSEEQYLKLPVENISYYKKEIFPIEILQNENDLKSDIEYILNMGDTYQTKTNISEHFEFLKNINEDINNFIFEENLKKNPFIKI